MDFKEKLNCYTNIINNELDKLLYMDGSEQRKIREAMRYSLMAGGKRLRPVLSLAVCEALDGDRDQVLPFACALEMIHTYSLIHDDLPAMDDDDYRRGRLTNHKVFGEAMAILAGDGLLNYAFEVMLDHVRKDSSNISAKLEAMHIIARSSGIDGMIGGQVVDLESEGKLIQPELLELMHRKKTGALIKASVLAAAALCNAGTEERASLERYADNLGMAFQIRDDILDVEGDPAEMGKNTGSDQVKNKATFVTLYGLEESKRMLKEMTREAVNPIEMFGEKGTFLRQLAEYLITRNN
ncbi:farnesyl diphosphate synthase [Pseudoclostridium thermosuccinogenes]|jgi:geranylgeranyl diphosphate synthase type II|uniref:polyprenyl synthetase family protein n=1 Tax=Clostridium thermosuccinogenes TaxID=84032 RepID=UPI002FDA00C3